MSEGLAQQLLPENRTGAGSIIANEFVAKSAPDGYTLLVVSGAFVTQAATMKKLPYESLSDFSFVSTIVTYPLVFSVRTDSRFRSLDEFIGFVKANPGKINYPSPGMGTLYHLAGQMFVSMAASTCSTCRFAAARSRSPRCFPAHGAADRRAHQLVPADPGGKIPAARRQLRRALALAARRAHGRRQRARLRGELVPGARWAAGLPSAVVERLNREVRRVLALPDIGQRFAEWGGTPSASTPEEMQRHVSAEIEKWKKSSRARKLELQ